MREFENIAYIDFQKTGTTTIVHALCELLDEREVYKDVHGPVPRSFGRGKPCFISVREPLSIYISLFNFATGHQRGGLYELLRKKGFGDFYRPDLGSFERWLEFMLDPKSAPNFSRKYGEASPFEHVGFLTVRLLYMSLPRFEKRSEKQKLRSQADVRDLFRRKRIFDDYVRTENLTDDLFAFLSQHAGRIRLRQPLHSSGDVPSGVEVRNRSRKIRELVPQNVSAALKERVREREWLFYESFGYDLDASGRPPKSLAKCLSAAGAGEASAALAS